MSGKYLLFFVVNIILVFSQPIQAISINEVMLCKDSEHEKLNCKTTIENNATINVSNVNKIWVVANMNNELPTNEVLLIRYLFKPSHKINFAITDTVTENNIRKPRPKDSRSDLCNKCNVFDIRLEIKSSPSYRTQASKNIDKNAHVGDWEIKLIDSNNVELYSKSLIIEK